MDLDDFLTKYVLNSPRNNKHFYHFTDTRNLPSIRSLGIYSAEQIEARKIRVVAPGGNQWSRDADVMSGMDKFVHLCFDMDHPMEFAARQDGRIKESTFLKIKPEIIKLPGVRITAEVSNKSGTTSAAPSDMLDKLDVDVL